MIEADLYAKIRRLFFAEHWRVGTIATELSVHHDTVRSAIDTDSFKRGQRPVRASSLDPYKAIAQETLEKYPRLRATRLYQMLRSRGYSGSIVQLRRYVAVVRPTRRLHEAFLRLRTLPGEQAQVDWGHFGKIEIGCSKRALSCFVMVLAHSRAMYARFTLDQQLESFLRCHRDAFVTLGGVPREILYDNLKSVVLERHGEHIRFHPQILDLAGHYHFAPKPCAAYRPNEKGKVERTINYLRYSFFEARRFSSIEDLNRQLSEWIESVAHVRTVPGSLESNESVGEALLREKNRLLPLPAGEFECDQIRAVSSGKQPYIRFDANDYSIPHEWVRKPLTLSASETQVRLIDACGNVVAQHERSYHKGQTIETPEHMKRLGEVKKEARALRGRDHLRSSCAKAEEFIAALYTRGVPVGSHVMRLTKLLELHGAINLDAALAEVIKRGAISSDSVEHVLEQKKRARREKPSLAVTLPDDPRVRDLRITPHELKSYDALGKSPASETSQEGHNG